MIPLSKQQREILNEFYLIKKEKVYLHKSKRNALWKSTTKRKDIDLLSIKKNCPALAHQIEKSYEEGNNIQQAVFSECVYAQSLADIFQLMEFHNCYTDVDCIPKSIIELLDSYNLSPRYMYCNESRKRMLIQAGGHNGVDSALITVLNLEIYTIEFKERGAKTGEFDLPKYEEDGKIKITASFLKEHPQFALMLEEQKDLNFFEIAGHNVKEFSPRSVKYAISNSYTKKYADVICTEDTNGYLIMFPANQIEEVADLQGEIRPAGRNPYKVWTPNALQKCLREKGAIITKDRVTISTEALTTSVARGGNGEVSRYKISPLFFVYKRDCAVEEGKVTFNLHDVRQLNPTIAGKMFLRSEINYMEMKKRYSQNK